MGQLLALRERTNADVMTNTWGYLFRLDRGELGQAGELLDLAMTQIDGLPEQMRPTMFAEAAYYTAAHRRDGATARLLLAQAEGGFIETGTRLRAEAAVLLAEGKFAEAVEKAQAGLEALSHSVDKGGAIAEREWLEAILNRAQQTGSGDCAHGHGVAIG